MKYLCIVSFTGENLHSNDEYDVYIGTTNGEKIIAIDSNNVTVPVELLYKNIILYGFHITSGDTNTYLNKLLNAGVRVLMTEEIGYTLHKFSINKTTLQRISNAPIESYYPICDNPFNFTVYYDREIIKNKWGTVNIYDNTKTKIHATIGRRVSWYHEMDIPTCLNIIRAMDGLVLTKDNIRYIGADKMPRFRAFLLCLKRVQSKLRNNMKIPQPIKWMLLNQWYFCE